MKRRNLLAAAAVGAALPASYALAQAYPSRPIRLIVPFAPGGSTDVIARAISESFSRAIGQSVVIENKAGAGGAIGTMDVVRAAPDGYTLLMVTPSVTTANPAINPKLPYNPVSDLTTIINVAAAPTILAVNSTFPAKDYKGFLAEIKSKPGKYSYATPGIGGILHLQMEAFKSATGTFVTHIPYRGAGPALNDVVAGQVAIIYDSPPSLLPYIKDGRLTPIVMGGPRRMKELPDLPTFKEVGVEGLSRMSHYGIVGPKGMSRDLVDKINAAVKKAVDDPAVRKRIEGTGAVVVAGTPEDFSTEIKAEYDQLRKVVVERKLTLD